MITNNEICKRKLFNDGYPTACFREFVRFQNSCEAYCTTEASCAGYIYIAGSWELCILTQSDKKCPYAFYQRESRFLASKIDKWLLNSPVGSLCYGKNSGTIR